MLRINSMATDIISVYTKNLLLYESHWEATSKLIEQLIKDGTIKVNGYSLVSDLIDLFDLLNKEIGIDHYSSFDIRENFDVLEEHSYLELTFNSSIEEINNGNDLKRKVLRIEI